MRDPGGVSRGGTMKRLRSILLIAGTFTVASAALPASMAAASPAIPAGTVQVTIVTPDGVPANVELWDGSGYFAAKPPSGTSATVTLTLPSDTYQPIVR